MHNIFLSKRNHKRVVSLILIPTCFVLFVLLGCKQAPKTHFTIAKFKNDKKCAISYTFDDGMEEHYSLVFPKFESLGFKGTFWINGKTTDEAEKRNDEKKTWASWNDLKTMAEHGHEISNHGWSHKNLTSCTPSELRNEIERNDSLLLAKIGEKPITYCYAYNSYNNKVLGLASVGRVGTRTEQYIVGTNSTSKMLEEKVESLIETGEWCVAMIHGINYGYDAFTNDSIFWNHLDQVKSKESEIWVGTFRHIAAYVKEQQTVKLDVTKEAGKWIIVPHFNLDNQLYNVPLTMVCNKKGVKNMIVTQDRKRLTVKMFPDKVIFDFDPAGGEIVVEID